MCWFWLEMLKMSLNSVSDSKSNHLWSKHKIADFCTLSFCKWKSNDVKLLNQIQIINHNYCIYSQWRQKFFMYMLKKLQIRKLFQHLQQKGTFVIFRPLKFKSLCWSAHRLWPLRSAQGNKTSRIINSLSLFPLRSLHYRAAFISAAQATQNLSDKTRIKPRQMSKPVNKAVNLIELIINTQTNKSSDSYFKPD